MTIIEKANAYDEAVENMRKFRNALNNHEETDLWVSKKDIVTDIEYYFPELKESRDEKIRKLLIRLFKSNTNEKFDDVSTQDIIAWLEKQKQDDLTNYKKTLSNYDEAEKEKCDFVGDGFIKCYADFQDFKEGETYWFEYIGDDKYNVRSDNLLGKTYHITPCQLYTIFKKQTWLEKQGNADNIEPKIEPKFHKGDWVIWQNKCYKVNFNGCGYELIDQNGLHTSLEYGTIDENAHLWTISDAKDGDVLYCKSDSGIEYIVMNKGINECGNIDSYFRYNSLDDFGFNIPSVLSVEDDNITPATKKQCDLLFKKLKEAGYEWNAEKKKPKKLGQQEVTKISDQEKDFIEIPFGAKDSEFIGDTYFIPEGCYAVIVDDMVVIKKGERKPAWNEEDDYNLQCMIAKAVNDIQNGNVGRNQELIDWLKSLKDKVQPQPQPKQEWSGEDETNFQGIMNEIKANKHEAPDYDIPIYYRYIYWLKSLKQRIGG